MENKGDCSATIICWYTAELLKVFTDFVLYTFNKCYFSAYLNWIRDKCCKGGFLYPLFIRYMGCIRHVNFVRWSYGSKGIQWILFKGAFFRLAQLVTRGLSEVISPQIFLWQIWYLTKKHQAAYQRRAKKDQIKFRQLTKVCPSNNYLGTGKGRLLMKQTKKLKTT